MTQSRAYWAAVLGRSTTQNKVEEYEASAPVFRGLISEVRELSKKKPETTMSKSKVKIVNRVLADLRLVLADEPGAKYLDELDEETLPQMSDAVLTMVQFETAVTAFQTRYRRYFDVLGETVWVTEEYLDELASR